MKIKARSAGKFRIIDLIGSFKPKNPEQYDLFEAELVKNQESLYKTINEQMKEGHPHIVLNLLDAHYIHSGGIGMLARILKKILDAKGKFYVLTQDQQIRETLDSVGLTDSLTLCASEEELLKLS